MCFNPFLSPLLRLEQNLRRKATGAFIAHFYPAFLHHSQALPRCSDELPETCFVVVLRHAFIPTCLMLGTRSTRSKVVGRRNLSSFSLCRADST
jgi:hypothetical protein